MHRILHGFFSNRDYPVVAPDYSSFGVVVGYGKGGVVPITTKLSSHKYYFWIGGVDLVLSKSRYHSEMVTGNGRGVVGPSTTHFSSKKVVFKRGIHNGGFISSQHEQTSSNLTSSFIKDYQLVLWVVLNLMLLVVKLVLVLGFPTSTPRKFSVVFIEVLLCHLRVGNSRE